MVGLSGRRPIEVFSDWVFITEATLQVLPAQIRAAGATGRFAPDPPEVADTFARVRSHYDPKYLGDDRAPSGRWLTVTAIWARWFCPPK